MEKVGFWLRVGAWFRAPTHTAGNADEDGSIETVLGEPTQGFGALRTGSTGESTLVRPRLSKQDRIEETYNKVVSLVESIHNHLERQDQRAEQVTRSLDRLADSVAQTPEMQKAQTEILSAMNNLMEADAARGKRVEESLSQLPRIADAQRETMVSIGRHLDLLRESNDRGANSLTEFQKTVGQLGEATTASTQALKEMQTEAWNHDERVAHLLQEQTKRLTLFAIVAIGMAVLAGSVGLVALLR